jgi:DEAD/DEAH box helicase domain-containing protein
MKDIPFGIEYVKNVDVMEVTLGVSSAVNANKIIINQQEDVPYHGFVTCKYCGKSTSKLNQRDYKYHFGFCKHKDIEYKHFADEVFEEVYLFREMKTEALKVLLPVQEFESESQVNMFKAGLELGLKRYYKGNPDHLSIINYSEYNEKNSRFDRYLVILDNIPGGTGYLEKLFSPTEFTEVIVKAYEAIRDCSCQHQGKDGCYRCIFTYSNQFIQDELSRSKAENLFKKIADKSNAWETFSSGLGSLSGTGQIEESELEERFIRSLRNYIQQKNSADFRFEEFTEDGIINYKFKLTNGDHSFYYVIRPQKELGPSEGVKFKTRADFFISLTGIEKNGNNLDHEEVVASCKSIAIYLDGYTYHATKENCRFYNDMQKRMAIVESGDKLSWTLTWNDLEKLDATEKDNDASSKAFKRDALAFDPVRYGNTKKIYEKIPYWNGLKTDFIDKRNSFERLLWLLANPLDTNKSVEKFALSLSLRQAMFGTPSVDEDEVDKIIDNPFNSVDPNLKSKNLASGKFYVFPELPTVSDIVNIKLAVRLSDLKMKASVLATPITDNLHKESWENFWLLFNLIQHSCVLTESPSHSAPAYTKPEENGKYDCLENFDEDLHPIIKQLIDARIAFENEGSFFLYPDNPFPEAALGFREKKIVIRPLSGEDKKAFEEAGFTEITTSNFEIEKIR